MATNFPGSIDSFTNPTSGDTLDSPSHAAQHTNINDAMVAVQTRLGAQSGTIGTWTAYTPTLTQGGGIALTVLYSKYTHLNDIVHWVYSLVTTGAGTGGNNIILSLPVTADGSQRGPGIHQYFDSNVATTYINTSGLASSTSIQFFNSASGAGVFGTSPAITVGAGDLLFGEITYVAA